MKDNDAKVSPVNKVIGVQRVPAVVVPLRLGVLNGLRIDFTMTKVQAKMARKYEVKIDMGLRFSIVWRFVLRACVAVAINVARRLRVCQDRSTHSGYFIFRVYQEIHPVFPAAGEYVGRGKPKQAEDQLLQGRKTTQLNSTRYNVRTNKELK